MADGIKTAAATTAQRFRGTGIVRLVLAVSVLAVATWIYGIAGGVLLVIAGVAMGGLVSGAPAPAEVHVNRQRFQHEMERARRFGHPLTLVRVPAAGAKAAAVVTHPSSPAGFTRRIDLAWMEGDDLYLTLYDTREEGAAMVLERLRCHGIETDLASAAVFPDGALTAGALRRQVTQGVGAPQVPSPAVESFRAPAVSLTE